VVTHFPNAGSDGLLGHSVIGLRSHRGDRAGQLITFTLDPAVQTVARSDPFIYGDRSANHKIAVAIPPGSSLDETISDESFLIRPEKFFTVGKDHLDLNDK
jgi:hypothetical protein